MVDQAIGTSARERHGRQWIQIALVGLLLWVASVVVTFATGNVNLVPTVILLGSFLVPVTFVVYAFERHADQVLTTQRIFAAFVYGGVLGVLGASVLEAAFLKRPSAPTYLGVGLVEEAVKLAALWLLAWRLPRYTMRDGIVLGAAVGFGFAALESAGYAFNALFTMEGLSLRNLVETEVLRGLLTPVGHRDSTTAGHIRSHLVSACSGSCSHHASRSSARLGGSRHWLGSCAGGDPPRKPGGIDVG